ncbi:hypothetical protein FISHEDRAFT_78576 [Fistulina hepatica ATCC 64428]|nr:hypothetical protein FISHEDRAFT_78576 [Fistulina hepatica ATCC 64428]
MTTASTPPQHPSCSSLGEEGQAAHNETSTHAAASLESPTAINSTVVKLKSTPVPGSSTTALLLFVIAIEITGIKVLPSIINACLVTSAWSATSSDLYTSSHALYDLAVAGNAPKIFLRMMKNDLPIISLTFCSYFALLCICLSAYLQAKSFPGSLT